MPSLYQALAELADQVKRQFTGRSMAPPRMPTMDEARYRVDAWLQGNPVSQRGPGIGVPTPHVEDYLTSAMDAVTPLPLGPLTFAGKSAKTADLEALARAQEMAARNVAPKDIWRGTGWWVPTEQGPNPPGGAPRFEIHDPQDIVLHSATPTGLRRQDELYDIAKNYSDAALIAEWANKQGKSIDDALLDLKSDFPSGFPEEAIELARSFYAEPEYLDQAARRYIEKAQEGNVESPLAERMKHPELYQAYPHLAEIPSTVEKSHPAALGFSRLHGSFTPPDARFPKGKIFTSGDLSLKERGSTGLHEAQHAIQHIEDFRAQPFRKTFSKGGVPEYAEERRQAAYAQEAGRYRGMEFEAQAIERSALPYRLAERLNAWQTHMDNPRTPYQLMKTDSWYRYSEEIRGKLGHPPKRPGPQRDAWVRHAAHMLQAREMERIRDNLGTVFLADIQRIRKELTPEQVRNKARYAQSKSEKVFPIAERRALAAVEEKHRRLRRMSDYELYRRLGGEVEARATQARLGLDPQMRREIPPWEHYDVPFDEIIP